ncbi:MAG: YhcH/YjgK/YiaL family protein [Aggregatilineales bacterium]
MIFDTLTKAGLYSAIHPMIAKGIAYLKSDEWKDKATGIYELEKDMLYLHVQELETMAETTAKWEAHRIYTDIQYVVSGVERIGYGKQDQFTAITEYNAQNDFFHLEGTGDFITVHEGMFTIFFPHDIHKTRVAIGQPTTIKKVVLKVLVD